MLFMMCKSALLNHMAAQTYMNQNGKVKKQKTRDLGYQFHESK